MDEPGGHRRRAWARPVGYTFGDAGPKFVRRGSTAARLLNGALDEMRRIRRILALYREFVERKIDSAIFGLVAPRVKDERRECRMQLRVLEAVIA